MGGRAPQAKKIFFRFRTVFFDRSTEHTGTPMPGQLAEDIALRYHEKEATAQLLDHYPKSVKVKCNRQCACKSTPFVM